MNIILNRRYKEAHVGVISGPNHLKDVFSQLPDEIARHSRQVGVITMALANALPTLYKQHTLEGETELHRAIMDGGNYHELGRWAYPYSDEKSHRLTLSLLQDFKDEIWGNTAHKRVVYEMAEYQYERADGKGCKGLKEDEIPTIAALCTLSKFIDKQLGHGKRKSCKRLENKIMKNEHKLFTAQAVFCFEKMKTHIFDLYQNKEGCAL